MSKIGIGLLYFALLGAVAALVFGYLLVGKYSTAQATIIQTNTSLTAEKKAVQLLEETGVTGPYVVLHPGSMRPEKYWLPERWAVMVDFFKNELGVPCIVTGAGDTYETAHIAAIKPKAGFHNLTGRTDLLTLASLIPR